MTKTNSNKSYKEMKQQLEQTINKLQNEDNDIDEALKLFEEGQQLILDLEKYLKTTENKITELKSKLKD